ncbi:hypothetical protein OROMI_017402 [Orobanche minor]
MLSNKLSKSHLPPAVQMPLLNNPLPLLPLHILYLLESFPLLKLHQICLIAHISIPATQQLLPNYIQINPATLSTHILNTATTHQNRPEGAH